MSSKTAKIAFGLKNYSVTQVGLTVCALFSVQIYFACGRTVIRRYKAPFVMLFKPWLIITWCSRASILNIEFLFCCRCPQGPTILSELKIKHDTALTQNQRPVLLAKLFK